MEGGFDCKIGNRKGSLVKRGGGSSLNRGKGRGLKAKLPVLFLPPTQNRGGGGGASAAARFGLPGSRRRPGLRGKGRGSCGGLIPGLTSSGGGVWRPGHGGQRRQGYKAGGGGARGAKEELGWRRWL